MSITGKSTEASSTERAGVGGEGAVANGSGAAMNGEGIDDRAVELIPPRYWWLKRLSIAAGLLVVALVVLRLWWGWAAERRLQAQIAEYRAAGQLVYADEIDAALAEIPDDENAAILYERAAEKMVWTTASGASIDQLWNEPAFLKANLAPSADLIEANAEALALFHQARLLSSSRWPCDLSSTVAGTCFPSFTAQRNLAKLSSIATKYYAGIGDQRSAIQTILDGWSQGGAISANHMMLGQLVRIACRHLVMRDVEAVAPHLNLAEAQATASTDGTFPSRGAVFDLISMMLDEEASRSSFGYTVSSERAYAISALGNKPLSTTLRDVGFSVGPVVGWLTDVLGAPTRTQESARFAEYASLYGMVISQATWSDGFAVVPEFEEAPSLLTSLSRPFSQRTSFSGFAGFRRGAYLCFRSLTERRLAATALAIRLFEIDHAHRPARLEALVPNYLVAVPSDPFAEGGGAIRFTHGEHGDVLYSLDEDGRDDEGVEFTLQSDGGRESLDIVFYLDGRPLEGQTGNTAAASTEAGEDDEDVDDGSGEGDEDKSGER